MSSTGTTGVRRKIAATTVARPPENAFAQHIPYAAMVTLITACCLAIEIMAPEHWQPNVIWFLLAPAGGLIAGAIPALIVVRRSRQRRADGAGKGRPDRPSAEGLRRRARRLGVVVRRRWQAERRIAEVRAARRAAVGLARGNAAGRPAGRGAGRRSGWDHRCHAAAKAVLQCRSKDPGGGRRLPLAHGWQATVPRRALRRLCRDGGKHHHGVSRQGDDDLSRLQ